MRLSTFVTIACAIGALGAFGAVVLTRPDDAAGPCVVVGRTAMLPEVPEASGLAISRRTKGLIWTHNDSGHAAVLFALDLNGTLRGRVRVPVLTRDWEDVSAARCPAGDCLYIADIGDNGLARRRIQIYRVSEPAAGDAETAKPDVFSASYADGRHNAEALFVVGDTIFIVTRDRTGGLYRSVLPREGGGDITLERIGQLGLVVVSDAETSPDETSVVVRTPDEVVIYRTADLVRGGTVPSRVRIAITGLREPQGEGVAFDSDGTLYLASEGGMWSGAGRFMRLRCTAP